MSERFMGYEPRDPETEWEVLVALLDPVRQKAAMERMLDRYGPVVRMRLAAAGIAGEEGEEAFQEFVLWVLGENRFAAAKEEKGRFRCFLAKMLTNWMHNRWRKAQAGKRGGGVSQVPWEEGMREAAAIGDGHFDRDWARALLMHAVAALGWGVGEESGPEEVLMQAMGGRSRVARERLLEALRREIRETSRYGLVEDELRYLLEILLAPNGREQR